MAKNSIEAEVFLLGVMDHREATGCLMSHLLDVPIIDDIEGILSGVRTRLEEIAKEPRRSGTAGNLVH